MCAGVCGHDAVPPCRPQAVHPGALQQPLLGQPVALPAPSTFRTAAATLYILYSIVISLFLLVRGACERRGTRQEPIDTTLAPEGPR
jgi:hypothetical protein